MAPVLVTRLLKGVVMITWVLYKQNFPKIIPQGDIDIRQLATLQSGTLGLDLAQRRPPSWQFGR